MYDSIIRRCKCNVSNNTEVVSSVTQFTCRALFHYVTHYSHLVIFVRSSSFTTASVDCIICRIRRTFIQQRMARRDFLQKQNFVGLAFCGARLLASMVMFTCPQIHE